MSSSDLLARLADGDFHSGAELGQQLGISRTAVWKQVQKLGPMGLTVESVKGRGYRLLGGLDLLNQAAIVEGLSAEVEACIDHFELLQRVESTNTQVLDAPEGVSVCLAEQQTAGRGRRGRTWVSPYGKNIYLSCAWPFEGGAAVLEGLSLAVGVALVRALANCGLSDLQLKWPNDLLWRGRKVAGILLEMSGDAAGRCQVVVGIGLNVTMAAVDAEEITQPWVSLHEVARNDGVASLSRNEIVAAILNQLLPLLANYEATGFAAWRDEWLALDAFRNCEVSVSSGRQQFQGVARGVDEAGALLLEESSLGDGVAGNVRRCSGGEVSLRLLAGLLL